MLDAGHHTPVELPAQVAHVVRDEYEDVIEQAADVAVMPNRTATGKYVFTPMDTVWGKTGRARKGGGVGGEGRARTHQRRAAP